MFDSTQHREASSTIRSRWVPLFRHFFVICVIVALVVPAAGYVASAQQPDQAWHEVRTVYTGEYGVSNPKGLVFSPAANAFLLWKEDGSAEGISMYEAALEVQDVKVSASDVRNIAFNAYINKVVVLGSDNTQLDEIPVAENGLPVPGNSAAQSYNLDAVNLRSARGMTFDPATGRMFVLNDSGDQLVITDDPTSGLSSASNVSSISLNSLEAGSLQGIAFNPQDSHLYLSDATSQKLLKVTQAGKKVAQYDLSSLHLTSPETLVFAPSVDRTDDPGTMDLFILDSGQTAAASTTASDGQIVEIALSAVTALPGGTPILPASLVRVQDISNATWNPSSPDPSGIDYWPQKSKLMTTDSEVDEMPPYWQNANVFTATTLGTELATCSSMAYTNEPTGLAINPNTNRIYISSDGGGGHYYEINVGADGEYCTADDTVLAFSLATDLEDVAYGNNTLFIAGGVDAEVYYFSLGANQVVGGGDDGPVQNFDTNRWGFTDMEGIGFNSDTGNILIQAYMGRGASYVAEVSTAGGGTLLWAYDVSFMGTDPRLHSDVAYAPSSSNPAVKNLYIVSRGVDNGQDSNENDGKWWEINIGDPIPTNTATFGPSPTATRTATKTATPSHTPTASPTSTFTHTATAATSTSTSTSTPTKTPTSTATLSGPSHTPTATTAPNLIFANGFESGNFGAWSSRVVDGGDLRVLATAAMKGAWGMRARIDDNRAIYVTDERPNAERRYRARFYFDPNSIRMVAGNSHYIFLGYSDTSTIVLRLEFRRMAGVYTLRAGIRKDNGTWTNTSLYTIADARHYLEINWRAATQPGANNGGLTFWIDGVLKANLTGIDNDTRQVDRVRLGAMGGIDTGTRGVLYFDDFISRRQTYIGP